MPGSRAPGPGGGGVARTPLPAGRYRPLAPSGPFLSGRTYGSPGTRRAPPDHPHLPHPLLQVRSARRGTGLSPASRQASFSPRGCSDGGCSRGWAGGAGLWSPRLPQALDSGGKVALGCQKRGRALRSWARGLPS